MIYFKEREYQNLELKDLDNFVFDLDGTLLNSEAKIITKNLEAILKLKALGKNIFIATGRHFHSARTYLDQVIPNFPVITANGAAIWDLKNIQVLKTFFIDKDIAKEIYDALVEWKYDFSIYTPDKMIGHNANKTGFFEKRNYIERLGDKYKEGNISHLINDLQVCKFYVLMDSNDDHTFHNINSIIKKYGDKVHAQVSDFPNVDIMSIKASKGNALEYLFKINNLDFNRTICFGDGENDFSMFKISKYSGSFKSSKHPEVYDLTSMIFESNNVPWIDEFLKFISKPKNK